MSDERPGVTTREGAQVDFVINTLKRGAAVRQVANKVVAESRNGGIRAETVQELEKVLSGD